MAAVSALVAVICLLVGFVLSLAGGHLPFDIVLLGLVFLAGWALLSSTWRR